MTLPCFSVNRARAVVVASAICTLFTVATANAAPAPISLTVDASEAPSTSIVHVRETIPATPGTLDLAYPRWVPGEHSPAGPVQNMAAPVFTSGNTTLAWTRDPLDVNEFHVTVPPGVSSVDATFDYLGSKDGTYGEARLATATILAINWNQFLLYPAHADIGTTLFTPAIVLPGADWFAGTALPGPVKTGNTIAFGTTSLERLVDSPLDAGSVNKQFMLLDKDGFTNEIDAFADRPSQLELDDKNLAKFKNIPPEMDAIYGARHWTHYHFLLTVSDVMPGNGVEHTSSSDDGAGGDALTDDKAIVGTAGLLSHEFNHSWDGKYRRPADLATTNFQVPEGTDLLWIYEGMTQFYGDLVPTRAGFGTPERFRDDMALVYANLDHEPGRLVRSLSDDAASAPFLYSAPRTLSSRRRSAGDFYSEGELLWLDVDAQLMAMSKGTKSLDGFCKTFFGIANTPPEVNPYTYDQFVAALNRYAPYNWDAYFKFKVFSVTEHPPSPFEKLGWKLVYTDKQSDVEAMRSTRSHGFEANFSLGTSGTADGRLGDVIPGSPAAKAGLGLGDQIVAIDDREFSPDELLTEMKADVKSGQPLRLIVKRAGIFRTVTVAYHDGPKYPHLVRIDGVPDTLAVILAPHRAGASAK
jgi:predicted metalloprotease with PDZ domain